MSFRATVEYMSKIMDEMGITELELERQFLFGVYRKHIHLSKQQGGASIAVPVTNITDSAATTTDATKTAAATGYSLKSPMVGVVYLAPEPGAKAFVKVGASVKKGETVALVEAMKTFNPIKADRDGVVKEILVSDGQAVEFDQPIIVME